MLMYQVSANSLVTSIMYGMFLYCMFFSSLDWDLDQELMTHQCVDAVQDKVFFTIFLVFRILMKRQWVNSNDEFFVLQNVCHFVWLVELKNFSV